MEGSVTVGVEAYEAFRNDFIRWWNKVDDFLNHYENGLSSLYMCNIKAKEPKSIKNMSESHDFYSSIIAKQLENLQKLNTDIKNYSA